jgi:hypothetical protein
VSHSTDGLRRSGDLDRALNERWPRDAGTTPDRPPIQVRARIVWADAGEQLLEANATRWSGRSVFVTPVGMRCRNGALGVWLDADDVTRPTPPSARCPGQLPASRP